MQAHTRRILIWSAGIAVFIGAIVGAAFLGIAMAKRDLPESAGETVRAQYPVGIIVTVGQAGEPVYFASEIQKLRDYWFAHPSAAKRIEAGAEEAGIRKIEGIVEVRTLRQDADVVEVDVLTSDASGETGWIHLDQLPRQP
jgi:hypothetical protein